MIAEVGLFCLILALMFAMLLVGIPTYGVIRAKQLYTKTASYYALGQFACVSFSLICLMLCFITDDFSVAYVLSNSSTSLPWFYKLCAVWGGHEGSMLLWVAILSLWMIAVVLFSPNLNEDFKARVLIVLGALSVGFLLFLLMTSNPFLRQFQHLNTEGRDLNPLLQDPGFLFHPPMLYMGYVGFSIAFAFAIAALWKGNCDVSWTKWARPWTLAAWSFLTVGITLGSWWAYRELGWGGWWFWDPVENASLMPWLVGTALIHSLAVSEQRKQFMAWTLLLSIIAFSLSLVGTFLVRSGVLTSVHAFAVDPQRGLFILGFLSVVIGGSLFIFAFRSRTLRPTGKFNFWSRETALLLNNVLLISAMLTVLMGTIYPLLIDGLGLGKLSVGAPYFNAVIVPLMIPMLLLMGVGIHLRWQKNNQKILSKKLLLNTFIILCLSYLGLRSYHQLFSFYTYLGCVLALWIFSSSFYLLMKRLKERGVQALRLNFLGMIMAHCGIAATVLGISLSSGLGIQKDLRMTPGMSTSLAQYQIRFIKELPLHGPNYEGAQAEFSIHWQDKQVFIYPEKRIYQVMQMAMTESAIHANVFRDIYIALGEYLGDSAWAVRIYYKPFVRWIWGGGFLILGGGILAMLDKRYFMVSKKNELTFPEAVCAVD